MILPSNIVFVVNKDYILMNQQKNAVYVNKWKIYKYKIVRLNVESVIVLVKNVVLEIVLYIVRYVKLDIF